MVRALFCRQPGYFLPEWLAALRFISGKKHPSRRLTSEGVKRRTKIVSRTVVRKIYCAALSAVISE
jgi:hypothetical protein